MMELTRKELGKMEHDAYVAFMSERTEPEIDEIFDGAQYATCYEIMQGSKTLRIFSKKSNLHSNFLTEHGFDPDETLIKALFSLNRSAKTLSWN